MLVLGMLYFLRGQASGAIDALAQQALPGLLAQVWRFAASVHHAPALADSWLAMAVRAGRLFMLLVAAPLRFFQGSMALRLIQSSASAISRGVDRSTITGICASVRVWPAGGATPSTPSALPSRTSGK